MLKTLRQAFSDDANRAGVVTAISNTPQKLIRSFESGKTVVVPGYIRDFTFKNDVRRTEISVDKITDRNWNWNTQNLFVFQRDRTRPATAVHKRIRREIRDA